MPLNVFSDVTSRIGLSYYTSNIGALGTPHGVHQLNIFILFVSGILISVQIEH